MVTSEPKWLPNSTLYSLLSTLYFPFSTFHYLLSIVCSVTVYFSHRKGGLQRSALLVLVSTRRGSCIYRDPSA